MPDCRRAASPGLQTTPFGRYIFRFVDERCRFLAALTPLQPRYAKKIADDDSLMAVILGQAMNHGNLGMAETNRIRHAGRHIAYRSVGSTLLVKGLEFANAVVVHSPNMNRKDWYVALTRATHTVKVLSPQRQFTPSA
jgi:hypothetical protein